MKKKFFISFILFGIAFIFIIMNCEKQVDNVPVKDADGNIYQTIAIGNQVWMVENLRTTHYRNGDAIPQITEINEWSALTTGAACDYKNDEKNSGVYGKLYNWYAITDKRNICPKGWHIPTDEEWHTLVLFLDSAAKIDNSIIESKKAGGKLKENGTSHWSAPNTGATNETGFTGLPGADRIYNGYFEIHTKFGYYWTSTENGSELAWFRVLDYDYPGVLRFQGFKKNGFSIRCIRD
jgi:uncharacterized protein (TIGR02145 family)